MSFIFRYIHNYSFGELGPVKYLCNNKPVLKEKECQLFPESRKNLKIFRDKYCKMEKSDKPKEYYIKYIIHINNTMTQCPNCNTPCCKYCKDNNAVHPKEKCIDNIKKICSKEYRTWRSYFSWDSVLSDHEESIVNVYTESLRLGLWGGGCPCQIVSKRISNEEKIQLLSSIPTDALDYHLSLI